MTQLSLTDDRILDAEPTDESTTEEPASGPEPAADFGPVADHPAVADVAVDRMVLETDADGWQSFPHPATIKAHVDEDMDADQATFPDHVNEAIDELTDDPNLGDFLVFDAEAAYEYLETLQKKSDLHLENFHRQQLIINQLSNGRGYAKGSSLSTYDKKWICQWEVRRRLAVREFNEWNGTMTVLSNDNSGLPKPE